MAPSLSSIKNTWVATTSHDSTLLQIFTLIAAAAFGVPISWELSEVWTRMFGYSSIMTGIITYVVYFTLYFCLSYVVTRTSIGN